MPEVVVTRPFPSSAPAWAAVVAAGLCLGAAAAPAAAHRAAVPHRAAIGGGGLTAAPVWQAEGTQTDGRYGTVAPAGDVNGDGYADALVGSYDFDHPEVDEGVVFLYLGSPAGLGSTPAWIGEVDQAGGHLGDKLSGAGDVNGDGYDDLVIGAGLYDTGAGADAGAAFLWLGGPAAPAVAPDWRILGTQAGAQFGACVQEAGDVNGDGFADVVVGSWLHDGDQAGEGAAFVYLGSDSGLGRSPAWNGEGNSTNAAYGYFCRSAGDVNGDGYDDLAIGGRRFAGNGLATEGRVWVYHGSPSGLHAVADWVHDGGRANGEFGSAVSTAGDVNGDGYDDLLVGAFRWDDPEKDEGAAFLFLGSATGLAAAPAWMLEGDQAGAYFGYHLDTAGDVNDDGYADVVLSASGWNVGSLADAGRALVYLGSPLGLATTPAWIEEGDQAGGSLESVRRLGDVNGDGAGDVMTGALYRDGAFVDAGRASLFLGVRGASVGAPPAGPTRGLELAAPAPNPFRATSRLAFVLPSAGVARLTVLDPAGRAIARLVDGARAAGPHAVEWDGRDRHGHPVHAGVWLVRLEACGQVRTARLVRLP